VRAKIVVADAKTDEPVFWIAEISRPAVLQKKANARILRFAQNDELSSTATVKML
jgi:hypothetical protein